MIFKKNKGYREIVTTIGKLKPSDKVMGTDKKWHNIQLLKIHKPKQMFEITFENGKVKCSDTHLWTYYNEFNQPITTSTIDIYNDKLFDYPFGTVNGPKILDIKKIKPIKSRCIVVDNHDHLFEILTDQDINTKKFKVIRNKDII